MNTAPPLTNRQRQILLWRTAGFSRYDICERLYITHQTLRNHLSSAYVTLAARNEVQAIIICLQCGIFSLSDARRENPEFFWRIYFRHLTPVELARLYFGPLTAEDAQALLWNGTAYPFADRLYLNEQLATLARASGGDLDKAHDAANKLFWDSLIS